MNTDIAGTLCKMQTASENGDVHYVLRLGEHRVPLNSLLGQRLTLQFCHAIHCLACGRKTAKSFGEGHCFPCFKKLARCDMCIVRPEQCHLRAGTCREPDWATENCLIDHYVYLANSSGLKVGITRHSQIPTRWMDQGATQAMPVIRVSERYFSGLVEKALASHIADKTNWRMMLSGDAEPLALQNEWASLRSHVEDIVGQLQSAFGDGAVHWLEESDRQQHAFRYPVLEYPRKIVSFNFDKEPLVEGTLLGMKGQYLIFDTGVINIRKFSGYDCAFSHA